MRPFFGVTLIDAYLIRPEKKFLVVVFVLPEMTGLTKCMT
jgi:hypothetical protein